MQLNVSQENVVVEMDTWTRLTKYGRATYARDLFLYLKRKRGGSQFLKIRSADGTLLGEVSGRFQRFTDNSHRYIFDYEFHYMLAENFTKNLKEQEERFLQRCMGTPID